MKNLFSFNAACHFTPIPQICSCIYIFLRRSFTILIFILHSPFFVSLPPYLPSLVSLFSAFYLPSLLQNQCTLPALPVFCAASLFLLFNSQTQLSSVQTDFSFFASLPFSLPFSSFPPSFCLCPVSPPSSNPSSPHYLSPWQILLLLFPYSLPHDLLLPILISFLCHSCFPPLSFLLLYLPLCLFPLSSLCSS